MNEISTNYTLDIEVLSPLHIGCGVTLRRDFDFVSQHGVTYRLNDQAILEELWPESEAEQQKLLSGKLVDLIAGVDLAKRPELALYFYRGEPAMGEIYEHIKDVFGHAYVPGSSLKGALRTAITRTIIEGVKQHGYTRHDIGPAMAHERDNRTAKQAADQLERKFTVGANSRAARTDSNYSLFRALAVGDSQSASKDALTLQRVQMVPELEIDAEAMRLGTVLSAPLRVDTYLLRRVAGQLGFEDKLADTVRAFARAIQFTAAKRVLQELKYHADREEALPVQFYNELRQAMQQPSFEGKSFYVQVGFATGWRAKSLLGGVPNDNPLLEAVVHDFHLDRGGKGQGGHYERGQNFPKARHLALLNGKPWLPMGWLKATITRL